MKPRSIRVNRRLAVLPVGRPVLPDLLTPDEVAEKLRLPSRAAVYALCDPKKGGRLGSVKVGRSLLVPAQALADFIERNTQRAAS